jgi:hypothetical protein
MFLRILRHVRALSIACLVFVAAVTPAAGQTPSDAWQLTVAPYLMAAGMSGTTTVAGQTVEVDASISDVFSNLQFGAMGIVVARKGDWGLGGDAVWVALGTSVDAPPANVDANQGMFAFYGLRRLSDSADVTFGLRWNIMQTTLDLKTPGIVREQTKQWVDPIVGLNLRTPASGRWRGGLYTEIGGFGAWQIFPTIGIAVGERGSLELGYRWISTDYETGENLTLFTWDVLSQGPVFGFAFRL